MKKEYDFSKGERGKFYRSDAEVELPIYIDADLREYFPDTESVNRTLRCLLPLLVPKKAKA